MGIYGQLVLEIPPGILSLFENSVEKARIKFEDFVLLCRKNFEKSSRTLTWTQGEKYGLGIDILKSEEEVFNICYPSELSSEGLDLGIERFCGSIGCPIIKEVYFN